MRDVSRSDALVEQLRAQRADGAVFATPAAHQGAARVLAVSHACVVDVNQRLFVEIGRQPGIDLTLIAPATWPSDLRGRLPLSVEPGMERSILPTRVWFAGQGSRMHLHLYPGWLRAILKLRPHLIFVDEEPYALSTLQFLLAAKLIGARTVFYSKQNLVKNLPPPFAAVERAAFVLADAAVALTPSVAAVLRCKGFQRPIAVIPHGVDLQHFRPADPAPLRSQLGLAPPVVAYIGRLAREKGVHDFLRLLELLHRQDISFTALCVGNGPMEGQVQAWHRSCGFTPRVRFLPAVPHRHIASYYNCADVVVVPSRTMPGWTEQFGRVLIEANACAVPVVGYDSGEIGRVLQATGGGISVPEGDVDQLAAQVTQLLRSDAFRAELGTRGRTAVQRHFSLTAVASQFDRLFRSLQ